MATSSSHTAQYSGKTWSTRRIAITALLCALAFITSFIEFPIFPLAPYLKYDPSGVIALVGGMLFGPVTGCVIVVLSWFLHLLVTFNFYGVLMAILANLFLTLPLILIWRFKKTMVSFVIAAILASCISVAVSIVGNLFVTPLYTSVSLQDVIAMILPILTPFNLVRCVLNCIITGAVFTPIAKAIRANHVETTQG